MKNQMKRIISLFCVMLILSGIPLTCFAAYGPSSDDLKGCNSKVVSPAWYNWLDSYETKYVKTKHGVCAYLRYEPSSDSDYFDYVYEKDEVTILARENGFSLVKVTDGVAGWVTSSVLVDSYPSSNGKDSGNTARRSNTREITEPEWYKWLDSYETKYVKTKDGVRAYLRYDPKSDSDYFDFVYEKDRVTVMARQNGFSLVSTANGLTGWVTSSVLTSRY